VIAFDGELSADNIGEQELALIGKFLPELLKEMIWQTSQAEE
jgi:hypothetical protein